MLLQIDCELLAFLISHFSLLDADRQERKAAVIAQFARVFGSEAALKPTGYVDHYWTTEEWCVVYVRKVHCACLASFHLSSVLN